MRNIHSEAWLLYSLTSIPFYEHCAQVVEDFANTFGGQLNAHGVREYGRLGHWADTYLGFAKEIRRRIEFVRHDDYMSIRGMLNEADVCYRGITEQRGKLR